MPLSGRVTTTGQKGCLQTQTGQRAMAVGYPNYLDVYLNLGDALLLCREEELRIGCVCK